MLTCHTFPYPPYQEGDDREARGRFLGLLSREGREASRLLALELGLDPALVEDSALLEPRHPGVARRVRQAASRHPYLARLHALVAHSLEARRLLVEENTDLVAYAVHRLGYAPRRAPLADRLAAGYLGLLRAADTYDPARGAFSTYALVWVRHALTDLSRREREEALSLDAPLFEEDGDGRTLADLLEAPHRPEDRALERYLVARALSRLSPRHREALERRFGLVGEEETLAAVGASWGVSRERARQVEAEALRRAREALGVG